MKRAKWYLGLLLVGILLFVGGCAEEPTPPTTTTATFPRVSDYCTIDVDYPSVREGTLPIPEGFVTVRKGKSVTLPVTIKSIADKVVKIRLTLGSVYPPEFVEYEYPREYMTLNPGETINTQIIVKALENARAGDYRTKEESLIVRGYLQEPELGKIFSVFYLSIEETPVPPPSEPVESSGYSDISIPITVFPDQPHIDVVMSTVLGGELTVTLGSNPTTGYQWLEDTKISDETIVQQTSHKFIGPGIDKPPGTSGEEVWTFKALKRGTTTILLEYCRWNDAGLWAVFIAVTIE